jgi:hypothetical protein
MLLEIIIMLIKFAIASNSKFESKSIPIVTNSLIENGIDPELIHVFSGGYDSYSYEKRLYHYHKLDHNSYEYSPLITIIEKELESEYWFLMHDTCKVGPSFKKLVYSIPESRPEKIALTAHPSMSIGSYRYDYLISNPVKQKLLAIKNTDYSYDAMIDWKFWGIPHEDYILFKTEPPAHFYSPEMGTLYNMEVIDYNNWYGTDTVRRTEYFKNLDLYKNKSNWDFKPRENQEINL